MSGYWRDMADAPRDGTPIRCEYHDVTLECRWEWNGRDVEDGGYWLALDLGEEVVPSRWAPLPDRAARDGKE